MKYMISYLSIVSILCLSSLCHAQEGYAPIGYALETNSQLCRNKMQINLSEADCETDQYGRSGYQKFRGLVWGQMIKQVWKNTKSRIAKNQISEKRDNTDNKDDKIQTQGVVQNMLGNAHYDLDVSSHRFILSVKVPF